MKKTLPPTFFLISVVAMILLDYLIPIGSVFSYPWNLVGLLPMGTGLVLNILADNQFKRAQTTIKPFEESSALVTDGVFRFSRNPMYLGIVAMLTGLALLLNSWAPWMMVFAFFFLIKYRFIQTEESMLAEKFGSEFEQYRESVRRWI